jgi:hypothetical protein
MARAAKSSSNPHLVCFRVRRLNEKKERPGAAPAVEHAIAGADPRPIRQLPLGNLFPEQDSRNGIVERKQPVATGCGDAAAVTLFLAFLPPARYRR